MATSLNPFSLRLSVSLAAVLAACCGASGASSAQTQESAPAPAPAQETVRFFTYENDSFFHSDRYYTSGVQFSVKHGTDRRSDFSRAWTAPLCRWLGCDEAQLLTTQSNLGQLMYTPSNITVREPQPFDRPWAGLLYYEQTHAFLSQDQRTLTTLSAQVGVSGRLSLAEPTQKTLHRLFDRPTPEGWDNQIGGSLGVMASAERRHAVDRLSATLPHDVHLNTATYWRLAAGNIMTYAAGGVAVVIGKDLPLVSPPPPGIGNKLTNGAAGNARSSVLTTCMAPWLQCTAFGSVEARVVGYNLFIDGRLFHDDTVVKRRNFVHDTILGMRFDFPRTRSADHGPWFVQIKATRRSPEIKSWVPIPKHRVLALTIGTEF